MSAGYKIQEHRQLVRKAQEVHIAADSIVTTYSYHPSGYYTENIYDSYPDNPSTASQITYILIAILLFTSCEYDPSGNNFIELTPPDDFIAIEISLNDIDPADTIYVFQDARVSVRINAEKKLKQAVALIDGKEYYLSNSSDFILRRNELKEGVHKLTVNAVFTSDTGSLAEMMGMEGYMGEMSWNIRIMPDIMPDAEKNFTVDYRLNEEGFLEFYWENAIPENYIKNYVVCYPDNFHTQMISNPTQKTFVDYGYVCGWTSYEITTNLQTGHSYSKRVTLNKPAPKIYFENVSLKELRIYWDKPFANGRFTLTGDGGIAFSSEKNDTTITIPQIFGTNRRFGLETRPLKTEYDTSNNEFTTSDSFCLGTSLGLFGLNWILYGYNTTDNLIYSTKYDQLVALDATTLQEKNNININRLMWGGRIACAPHNSTVAAMTGEETWIFADSRFINPVIIPNLSGNINTRLSALTSNDRFFVVPLYFSSLETSFICYVFNAKTGEKIFDFSFTHGIPFLDSPPNCVTVSDDGRYFFAASIDGMELFEISGTTANLLYADARRYTTAKEQIRIY